MEKINEEQLNLLAKHLRKETSAFEENLIKEWLNESSQNEAIYKEVVFLWKAGKAPSDHKPDVEKAWQKVKAKTHLGSPDSESLSKEGKVRPMFDVWTYMKVAATLLLFLSIGYMVRTFWFSKEALIELSSGDQKKEIYLPDSSRVWLNKNSSLSYTSSYNESFRTVKLEGEAFFEVRKDKVKPFIVNGRNSKTEVLGTSFNVRSFKDANADEVEVFTGKVGFSSRGKIKSEKVFLLPGDKAIAQENGHVEKLMSDNRNLLAWKSEKLVFDNTSLKDVVETLENYFDVPVQIQSSELLSCRFTGSFSKPGIEEILKVLSVSINLSYSKKDKTYLLTGKGCN